MVFGDEFKIKFGEVVFNIGVGSFVSFEMVC